MAKRGENIYKRKDGRYEGRYVVGKKADGRTRFGYVYDRSYAGVRTKLCKVKAALTASQDDSACRTTVEKCMRLWLESELRGVIKPSSYQTYLSIFTNHIQPKLGHMNIGKVTRRTVLEFAENLMMQGLAAGTVKGVCRLLSACMLMSWMDSGSVSLLCSGEHMHWTSAAEDGGDAGATVVMR